MKTFDEALKIVITANHEVKYADTQSVIDEHLTNKGFTDFIAMMACEIADKRVIRESELCQLLHKVFYVGQLVGMEMEKSE